MVAPPVDPDNQEVLQQAHHEDEQVDEEEGNAPVVGIQLDGALIDEPRRAVQEVQRVVVVEGHGLKGGKGEMLHIRTQFWFNQS